MPQIPSSSGPSAPTASTATEQSRSVQTSTSIPAPTSTKHANADDRNKINSTRGKLNVLAFQAGLKLPNLKGKTEAESIALRSDRRLRLNAVRRQKNIESIIAKAQLYCNDTDVSTDVDLDWYYTFVELAENINGSDMQELWAKILAGEIARPNSFSIKTLFLLKKMTLNEAKTFANACALMTFNSKYTAAYLITGFSRRRSLWTLLRPRHNRLSLSKFDLPYGDILALIDIGLLLPGELESGEYSTERPQVHHYQGRKLYLQARHSGLVLNYFKFSEIGIELSKLISLKQHDAYFEAISHILEQAFSVSE